MMASSLVNSSMPRKMLLASGGFNEEIRSAEDMELGLRLWKAGTKFRLLPTAVTQELFVKSSHAVVKQQTKVSARGELYVCRKHPEYRPHSGLARIGLLAGWKRTLRNMAVRSPLSPVPLLTLPIWLAERLSGFIPIRKAGIRLLEIAAETTLHRAALQGTGSWKALQREFGMRLPALMYHHVGPSIPHTYAELTVLPKQFERQIRWLARRGFVGILPADWVKWLRTGKGLPDKPVLVTFDDGYADLAEFALPVLRRYGFGAVVFVVTGLVGRTNAWDEARGSATHRLLTSEQIRYWATQGIEFGAHSRTHTDLTTLSAEELAKEIVGGRDELANLLGSPVTSFAYPYGAYNQTVNTCARGAYSLTFRADETNPGINYLCTDPHDLQRTMIHPKDSLADLECRVRWGHSPIQEMRERLRLRSRLRRVVRFFFGRSR
jgi:peptidoglycan/xylan/chitin deacetylase (PgdA/CDA1 family)